MAVEGPFWASMIEIAGESSGAGGGVLNMGGNLGGTLSPWLTPVLAAAFGWVAALDVAAAVAACSALLWLFIYPGGPPVPPEAFPTGPAGDPGAPTTSTFPLP
jgi:ACS family glucarate transporter-like MFS transporter